MATGCSDQAVVIKKIPVGTSVKAVHTALSEFGVIKSVKMQLDFISSVGGKTCVIDHHLVTYGWARCAIVCFELANSLDAIMGTTSMLREAYFHWSHIGFAMCTKCGKLGYTSLGCVSGGKFSSGDVPCRVLSDTNKSRLAAIYAKRLALVVCLVSFGGISWAKIVAGFSSTPLSMKPTLHVSSELNNRFAILKRSLTSLAKYIDKLAKKLDASGPTVSQLSSGCQPLGSSVATSDGTVVGVVIFDTSVITKMEETLRNLSVTVMSLSAKMENGDSVPDIYIDNLVSIFTESKLKGKVHTWIINKFNGVRMFTSGLESSYLGADIVVVINFSLAKHICKVSKVPSQLLSIKLFFKNKLLVSILGLYTGASSVVRFSQASNINFFITKAVNEASFIILSGDFNEDSSYKYASFKKCLDLGLVNSLVGSPAIKEPTWANSRGIIKTIDYVLVFLNLVDAIVNCNVSEVSKHFDTNYQSVSVSVDLGGLLDMWLNSLYKQANKDQWKFDFKIMVLLANKVFKKKWFKGFDNVFTKESLRFHKLKLLECITNFEFLMEHWISLDNVRALVVQNIVDSGAGSVCVCSALFAARRSYHASKLAESLRAKKANIRSAIDKRIESFEVNKGHMIKSVLKCLFCKVVFDYLVVDNNLILEPNLVKFKVDVIMEGWTRKHQVINDVSGNWSCQYQSLEYVFNEAFSSVMCSIGFDELFGVISHLPDGKAAGLLGISNELWKHCDRVVLDMLMVLLNSCLSGKSILSKILSDRISLVCSIFDVLCGNNFSFPIFAIGSVIEDALEKNQELWLVLQDMRQAYDSVGWEHLEKSLVRIKMCSKFIQFFGSIHRDHTNCVMTDFSLTDGYCMHDGLDQEEVFSLLLWHIFYDSLLCEVKHQESVCEYRLISHFVSKNGHAKSQFGLSSFFAAGVFIDDTIWVSSEFFRINNILINNNKTVAIFINSRVSNFFLSISGLPISIAKKGESHQYLGSFLLTKSLLKSSLTKTNSDVRFFTNLVLRKTVSDKQFLYLVLAIFYSIVSYKTQFNALVHKGLKIKSGLPLNFPSDTIHHPSFYGLKTFVQVQSESKIASLVSFANSNSILGHLFSYRSHNLQVLCWCLVHFLYSPVCICVSAFDNYLADMVCIFLDYNLSLGGFLASFFHFYSGVPMSAVLSKLKFLRFLPSLQWYGIAFHWKRLDPHSPVPKWFKLSAVFLNNVFSLPTFPVVLNDIGPVNIFNSGDFVSVCKCLSQVGAGSLSVYMDGSLKDLGIIGCRAGAAAFFENIGLGLSVSVLGLMLSTLAELQAIALALECILSSSSVYLYSDSQAALDAYRLVLNIIYLDFYNQCWVEHQHIVNVKGYFGILGNEHADAIVGNVSLSSRFLPPHLSKCFLMADGSIVSGNS
ncbi:hypothetical protein G9A89_010388 [Geosiphon pyriformis]|nr:hypothetical protein G9A89_010388 [Geosiphon pyriformis]